LGCSGGQADKRDLFAKRPEIATRPVRAGGARNSVRTEEGGGLRSKLPVDLDDGPQVALQGFTFFTDFEIPVLHPDELYGSNLGKRCFTSDLAKEDIFRSDICQILAPPATATMPRFATCLERLKVGTGLPE
jgi:hypothetical protein